MRRFVTVLLLSVALLLGVNLPSADDGIKTYPLAESAGGTAPGMTGNTLSHETMAWVWGLTRVPFVQNIPGVWTDYYFSAEAGGLLPQGATANDGLTPETPKRYISDAKTVCFTIFNRCNFDSDTWESAGQAGADEVIGSVTETEIGAIPTGYPTALVDVLEQPGLWWRSMDPKNPAVFDFTGVGGGVDETMQFQPNTRYIQWLWEAISVTGEDLLTAGVGSPPVDVFEFGVLTLVGEMTVDYAGAAAGTGQVLSAHDAGILRVFGQVTPTMSGTPTAENLFIGGNGSSTLSIHTSIPFTNVNGACFAMNQSTGGTAFPAVETEMLATASQSFVSGLYCDGTAGANFGVYQFEVDDGNSGGGSPDSSNNMQVVLVNVGGENSTNVGGFGIRAPTAGANLEFDIINSSPAHNNDGVSMRGMVIPTGEWTPTSTGHIRFTGNVWPYTHEVTLSALMRIQDEEFIQSPSTLTFTDFLYTGSASAFYMENGASDCTDNTLPDWLACANMPSEMLTLSNVAEVVATVDSTASANGLTTTLIDTITGFTDDEYNDAVVIFDSGSSNTKSRRITDTDGATDTITFAPALGATTATNDQYRIVRYTDAKGYCRPHLDPDCEDFVAGAETDYTVSLPSRTWIPAFITGKTGKSYSNLPANAGRLPPEPWATR